MGVGGKGEKVDPRRPPGEIGRRIGRFEGLDAARDIFLSFRKENGHLTMIKVSITIVNEGYAPQDVHVTWHCDDGRKDAVGVDRASFQS